MVNLSSGSRYYLWREPVDMRKSFDGLQGLVTGQMGRDALSGEVFIFMNRRRDQVKMLVWDRSGFVIYYKRLERGRFELPAAAGGEQNSRTGFAVVGFIADPGRGFAALGAVA